MMKKMTALLLALVLCVGLAANAFAAQGPYRAIILKDGSGIDFSRWNSDSYHRAMAVYMALTEMWIAGVNINNIDLTRPVYVGWYPGFGALDVFLPTSEGYLNPCFGKDGIYTIYELPAYTPSRVESEYPTYMQIDPDDLTELADIFDIIGQIYLCVEGNK